MTLLLCFTVFAVILIGESILLGWERWALVLVVAGLIGAWIALISDQMTCFVLAIIRYARGKWAELKI